ncbi:MAG: STAS domain-containing protein [Campylobacterota bacterium]|nr:STAS domain-containing protein [Campylobacterota bacterium]
MLKLKYDKLTIYEVEELHETILESYTKDSDFALDLQDVQKIDMTVIQLLLCTQKSCKDKNINFSLHNLSDELVKILKISGCDLILGVAND